MADIVKVNLQGNLPGGEVWSINPVFQLFSSPPVNYAAALAACMAVGAVVPGTALRSTMHSATTVTKSRLEFRSLGGTLETQAEANLVSPVVGNGTGGPHPYQTSTVFSLRSVHPGGSGRGRLYWPFTGGALGATDYRISAANVTAQLTDMKTYLSGVKSALATSLGTDVYLVVWSRRLSAAYHIERILQGDVVDTQRRRRDTLKETYQTVAFP